MKELKPKGLTMLATLTLAAIMLFGLGTKAQINDGSLPPNDTFDNELQPTASMRKGGCTFYDDPLAIIDSLDAQGVLHHGERRRFREVGGNAGNTSKDLDVDEPTSRVCALKSKRTRWGETESIFSETKLTVFYDHFSRTDNCSFTPPKHYTASGCKESSQVAENCSGVTCPPGMVVSNRDCGCEWSTPIIGSMTHGARFDLSTAANGIPFDINADGTLEWVASPLEADVVGFLYLKTGLRHNGRSLFGNIASQKPLAGETRNGFAALRQWDDKQVKDGKIVGPPDGFITPDDGIYGSGMLGFWFDLNRNGLFDFGEFKTLAELNIVKLETHYVSSNRQDGRGNKLGMMAKFWKAGDPSPYFLVDYNAAVKPLR